jgi:hypothetical protein
MKRLSIRWARINERKVGLGWVTLTGCFVISALVGVSMWFFTYRLCTRMSMETWARYAGALQASVWSQQGRHRLLELSPEEPLKFTGRTEGPFEIWTWRAPSGDSSLTVQTDDAVFVDAFNVRMRQLWKETSRRTGAEADGTAKQNPPFDSETNSPASPARSLR